MQCVWGGERKAGNTLLSFSLEIEKDCDELTVCGADFFKIYLDGRFVRFGPNRTAAGYARPSRLSVKNVKRVTVEVFSNYLYSFHCDWQEPYFGAELSKDGKTVYTALDFAAERDERKIRNVPRYSRQRGWMESYDLRFDQKTPLETYPVPSPALLGEGIDRADYVRLPFDSLGKGVFNGFDKVDPLYWYELDGWKPREQDYNVTEEFVNKANGYKTLDFSLKTERTGFLSLEVESDEEQEVFAVFEEIQPDGIWFFRRGACNDFVRIVVPKGKTSFTTFEPYTLKYLKILSKGEARVTPSLISCENDEPFKVRVYGNEKVEKVFAAAENTYRQNAVDLFTDCPGRERAGWLCDSWFTAKAEYLYTGENAVEKDFLENIILAQTPELPEGVIPMCFPSEHWSGKYIPNWMMWFIMELHDCFLRTRDRALIEKAREKVYGVLEFFKKYENEYGLLEDLESWVFLEWSVCNDPEYTKGVNFPSNMLYAATLEKVADLYGDERLYSVVQKIRKEIARLSFDGEFFADNAVRENGELKRCDDHVSETCQYYALFTGLCPNGEYAEKIKTQFGPLRKEGVYPEIGRSNMFIGNYLRFFWLTEIGEKERVIEECLEYFSEMASETGTLWENDKPTASCNHGFASVAAVLLLNCLTGYKGWENGKPVFEETENLCEKYGVTVEWQP